MTDETKPRQPWTPGPWALGEENCGGGSNVRAVVTESAEGAVVGWTARVVIAGDEVVSDAAANANAWLMAAAPAMAEALARFVEHGEGCAACGMEGRLGCGCKQEQGRAALELCGWRWS